MIDEDSPNRDGDKADLLSILNRRKRTVKSYMLENGITNKVDLKNFLAGIKDQFFLSKTFLEECNSLFKNKNDTTASKNEKNNKETSKPRTTTTKRATRKRSNKKSTSNK